jgi:hypothetical protein
MTNTSKHRHPPPMPAVPEVLRRLPAWPGAGLLLFAAAAAAIAGSLSMQDMGELPMPGGWTLSTAWMPMCGQSWSGAATSFTGMWAVMMVAMMLPALLPRLRHERPASAALTGAGYFFVWTVLGAIIFALGAALAQALLQMNALARTVPALPATAQPCTHTRDRRLAPRPAAGSTLRLLLRRPDGRAAGDGGDGPACHGRRHGCDHG